MRAGGMYVGRFSADFEIFWGGFFPRGGKVRPAGTSISRLARNNLPFWKMAFPNWRKRACRSGERRCLAEGRRMVLVVTPPNRIGGRNRCRFRDFFSFDGDFPNGESPLFSRRFQPAANCSVRLFSSISAIFLDFAKAKSRFRGGFAVFRGELFSRWIVWKRRQGRRPRPTIVLARRILKNARWAARTGLGAHDRPPLSVP